MQGCLTQERLGAELATSCAHCDRPIHIDIDEHNQAKAREGEPLLFQPSIDWTRFNKPHIIDDF